MQYQALERKKKIAKELLLKGYNEMIKCLQPETIIIHGINTTTAGKNIFLCHYFFIVDNYSAVRYN